MQTRGRSLVSLSTVLLLCGCGGKLGGAPDAGKGGGGRDGGSSELNGGGSAGAISPGSSEHGVACAADDLQILFAPDMYSAYIAGNAHVFQVPATALGAGGSVEWTASDPSVVQIDKGDQDASVTLTVRSAGEALITAKVGGHCGTSTLHVTAATEEQWQTGSARYNSMYPLPEIRTDGGVPVDFMSLVLDPPGMPPACTSCHGQTATSNVFRTVPPIPELAARYSDQELIDIFTKATFPPDPLFDPVVPASILRFFHSWSDMNRDQAEAMVVYLRSLRRLSGGGDFGAFTPAPHGADASAGGR